MKKIIHLTDLHMGYKDDKKDIHCTEAFINIVGHIITDYGSNADEYVIVITGDLCNSAATGDEEEYEHNGKTFMAPPQYIIAKTEIKRLEAENFKVLVIPGNHDYGMKGTKYLPEYVEKFKKMFLDKPDVIYPTLYKGVSDMAFIGLDSMDGVFYEDDSSDDEEPYEFEDDDEDTVRLVGGSFAYGKITKEQLERFEVMLNEQNNVEHIVIYLHHHPFNQWFGRQLFHGLHGYKDLKKLVMNYNNVNNNVKAILYGHNHHGYKWNYRWGVPRFYDGGSSTGKGGHVSPHRIIDLSEEVPGYIDGNFYRP
ncbi:MAG: hypothetical protein HOF76_01790 [Candidatus Scalindua sp.]|jgi:3',5'-cyclic AMP phosphodiesterase CpdA|nr:hypothetical protein [Candidatus Scalindua sp.]MBT6049683.1 hypothetical protein [Candidatus Scalindua sp.]